MCLSTVAQVVVVVVAEVVGVCLGIAIRSIVFVILDRLDSTIWTKIRTEFDGTGLSGVVGNTVLSGVVGSDCSRLLQDPPLLMVERRRESKLGTGRSKVELGLQPSVALHEYSL